MSAGRGRTRVVTKLHLIRKALKTGPRWYVYAWRGERRGGFHACCQLEGGLEWRESATPALALCAASLRAMAGEGRP